MATRTGSGLPLVASECLSFESLSTADSVTSLSLASHSAAVLALQQDLPSPVACKQADTTMVEVLLTYGADEMQQDRKGRTPADVAERYNRFGSHDGVLQALMAPERWRPHIRLRASTVHSLRARGT
eukprot:CAMPEP_0195064662 /NCGR_PEP_ID=MMETSP0448-20130528/10604_1 /TAXON_ID=66468 /ORGANISM="Heterocapsa triquestra, Strain CCMP 448" /LENGTH=126 /DNA_ID=CAMNT_0040095691 /DNA_START=4 /DNA_END=385 /DNA_ORIENTATION=+